MPSRSFGSFSHMSGLSAVVNTADLADTLAPPPSSIPAGFDAVLQLDPLVLQRQLIVNLSNAGLAVLSIRVPYRPESLPSSLRSAIETHLPRFSAFFGQLEVEVRLVRPQLRTLRSPILLPPIVEPPENAEVSNPTFISSSGPSHAMMTGQLRRAIEIDWVVELNLVERTPKPVLAGESGRVAT